MSERDERPQHESAPEFDEQINDLEIRTETADDVKGGRRGYSSDPEEGGE